MLLSDYSKLPKQPTVDLVYLLDPLVATGGTAVAAINMLIDWGISSECRSPIQRAYGLISCKLRISDSLLSLRPARGSIMSRGNSLTFRSVKHEEEFQC